MMDWRRIRIHWAWVPAAVFFALLIWQRSGPVVAFLLIGAGVALGLLGEWRAQRRGR